MKPLQRQRAAWTSEEAVLQPHAEPFTEPYGGRTNGTSLHAVAPDRVPPAAQLRSAQPLAVVGPAVAQNPTVAPSSRPVSHPVPRPTQGLPSAGGLAGVVSEWWRARTQPAHQMRLVETLQLGPKRSVALLELDGERFLVGMGADGVSTLLQLRSRAADGDDTL